MRKPQQPPRGNLRWFLLVVAVDLFAYYGTILLNRGAVYHTMDLPLDAYIPFVPAMMPVYVLAFVQWVVCFALLVWGPPRRCRSFALGIVFTELLCAACFLLWPTWMANRPIPEGGDLCSRLTALIFSLDNPSRNLFPSLHCAFSWLCLRITLTDGRLRTPLRAANVIFTLLVFASVVLVKQHVLVDIPAGVAAAELGLLLARLCLRRR